MRPPSTTSHVNEHRSHEAAADFDEGVRASLSSRGISFLAKAAAANAAPGADPRRYLLDDNGRRCTLDYVGVVALAGN